MTDLEWIRERETNAQRIAETKLGAEREGWIDDASRFAHVRRKLALFDEMFFRLQVTTREWQMVFGSEEENSTPGDVLEKNKALIIKVQKMVEVRLTKHSEPNNITKRFLGFETSEQGEE